MFQRVLIAWDGSRVARRALDVAIDLGRRYDVELVAISIAYSPAHAETATDRSESVDAAQRYLSASFDEVRDRGERAGVDLTHEIVAGDEPHAVLLEYAHEHGFDLIVCGHHRAGRAGRLLLQDIAPRLIAAAPMPVLVVSDIAR